MISRPVYRVVLKDDDKGIIAISLVEKPAIEEGWVMLSAEEVLLEANEEKHLLTGPILIPDKPILRRKGSDEYYITFSREVIEEIAQRTLKDQTFSNIDLQHNGTLVEGVELLELYIKDSNKGLQFDVADGSLIATYRVTNPSIWEKAKAGEIKGFSLSGIFTIEEDEEKEYEDLLSMLKKVRHCR